jgi:hypothetical protein
MKTLFVRVLLGLVLLFAQHQAVLHELGHDFDRLARKAPSTAPHDDVCLKCLSLAQLDHAGGPAVHVLPVAPCDAVARIVAPSRPFLAAALVPYLSRGPPAIS